MDVQKAAGRRCYAGLFLVTLATLMHEILLTRIFSVTMWYHFAFVAISVAMFGMTVGAILVYVLPRTFTPERASHHLAWGSLWFAITVILSFLTLLCIPFEPEVSIVGAYCVALTYIVISVPFVFSGVCVCLALTRFPAQISKLYAADLAGAALGCVVLVLALPLTDGPTAVFLVALLACGGAAAFASQAGSRRTLRLAIALGVLLAVFCAVNTVRVHHQDGLIRLTWVKGKREAKPLYEKWNSFSRIRVHGNPDEVRPPSGCAFSSTLPQSLRTRELYLDIDADAGTVLTRFDGDLDQVAFLKYDVTNIAHYIRPQSHVLVIGAGGGRDILSALVFDQKSVVGVEINENILHTLTDTFADFTGHLQDHPKVRLVNDEARSFVARSRDQFDIIQVSMIDTFAATAAGAFVLSEHSLYTVQAWRSFLDHLSDRGVVTFSRWYYPLRPAEMHRLTCLGATALQQAGVANPRDHLAVVCWRPDCDVRLGPQGVGTLLMSKKPFTPADIQTLRDKAREMKFDLVLTPAQAGSDEFARIAEMKDPPALLASFPLNIEAPTDDSPFFFHTLRMRDFFRSDLRQQGTMSVNLDAIFVLGVLLGVVLVLTGLCILLPLALASRKGSLAGAWPFLGFFCSIGMGFMLVEISQMQRLNVFLGHPIYGLSVVLFTLLLSSGLGSLSTQKLALSREGGSGLGRLVALLGLLALFGLLTPWIVQALAASQTPVRIAVAIATLFPLGFFMGMAFPLGMKLASRKSGEMTPWLWGANGATSVCASVLAIVIALTAGIAASFWTGFAFYCVAAVCFAAVSRKYLA